MRPGSARAAPLPACGRLVDLYWDSTALYPRRKSAGAADSFIFGTAERLRCSMAQWPFLSDVPTLMSSVVDQTGRQCDARGADFAGVARLDARGIQQNVHAVAELDELTREHTREFGARALSERGARGSGRRRRWSRGATREGARFGSLYKV